MLSLIIIENLHDCSLSREITIWSDKDIIFIKKNNLFNMISTFKSILYIL